MGCVAAAFAKTAVSDKWAELGRGPKLRHLFGAYGAQDCWAVQRRFRQIDDGDGYVSYEELEKLVGADDFSLLFIWEFLSMQDELIDIKELMTLICFFSSARLEDKAKFLLALFDESKCSVCTGAELTQLCTVLLGLLARCIGAPAVKVKELGNTLKQELHDFLEAYAEAVQLVGRDRAFNKERVVHHSEVATLLAPLRSTYDRLAVARAPPADSPTPPSAEWGVSGLGAKEPLKKTPPVDESESKNLANSGPEEVEPHLAWMKLLEEDGPVGEIETEEMRMAKARRQWLILHSTEFGTVAKDVHGFHDMFNREFACALAVPPACVEFVNVTAGSPQGDSTVVEFLVHQPPPGDDRDAAYLVLQLEYQLKTRFSALRQSKLGAYLDDNSLVSRAPQRAEAPVAQPGAAEVATQATQTEAEEFLLLEWPVHRPAPPRPADPAEAALMQKLAAAQRQLEQMRARADAAEAEVVEMQRREEAMVESFLQQEIAAA